MKTNCETDLDIACPGCKCMPGDGRTEGCKDPDGCGYGLELTEAELTEISITYAENELEETEADIEALTSRRDCLIQELRDLNNHLAEQIG